MWRHDQSQTPETSPEKNSELDSRNYSVSNSPTRSSLTAGEVSKRTEHALHNNDSGGALIRRRVKMLTLSTGTALTTQRQVILDTPRSTSVLAK